MTNLVSHALIARIKRRKFAAKIACVNAMRLNGLTITNVLDHLCKAIQINNFVTQPLNRMRQNEKNRHKNRPCKRGLKALY